MTQSWSRKGGRTTPNRGEVLNWRGWGGPCGKTKPRWRKGRGGVSCATGEEAAVALAQGRRSDGGGASAKVRCGALLRQSEQRFPPCRGRDLGPVPRRLRPLLPHSEVVLGAL